LTPQEKDKMDITARLQQMKINTRLTALQTALELMKTPGYLGVPGSTIDEPHPIWIHQPGKVDCITLLAMAAEFEAYVIGDLEAQAKEFIDVAGKPPSNILKVRS
jgi:hypothetical protein